MQSSRLTGLRYTGPMGDQLRGGPVHSCGVRFLARVFRPVPYPLRLAHPTPSPPSTAMTLSNEQSKR